MKLNNIEPIPGKVYTIFRNEPTYFKDVAPYCTINYFEAERTSIDLPNNFIFLNYEKKDGLIKFLYREKVLYFRISWFNSSDLQIKELK